MRHQRGPSLPENLIVKLTKSSAWYWASYRDHLHRDAHAYPLVDQHGIHCEWRLQKCPYPALPAVQPRVTV
eukprot:1550685-Pyramimonas_sp.AAC.1